MKKCIRCGDLVNLMIANGPDDICMGCLTDKEKYEFFFCAVGIFDVDMEISK
jgi:hypothetical protein